MASDKELVRFLGSFREEKKILSKFPCVYLICVVNDAVTHDVTGSREHSFLNVVVVFVIKHAGKNLRY